MDIIDFSKTPNVKKVKVGISLFIKFTKSRKLLLHNKHKLTSNKLIKTITINH